MPTTVSLASLVERVRLRTNQPNPNGFVSDSEIESLLVEGYYDLYDRLVEARGADYYSEISGFTTTAGQERDALAGDFYRLISLVIADAPGGGDRGEEPPANACWYEVPRFQSADWAYLLNLTGDDPQKLRYQVTGVQRNLNALSIPQVIWCPIPQGAWFVGYRYLPTLDLTVGMLGLTFDGINGWEAYVVAHAAATILQMQEEDASVFLLQKREFLDRIRGLSADRDRAQPLQVRDWRGRRTWRP